MIRQRRTVATVMVAAGFAMLGSVATAHAQTPDEYFTNALKTIGIPLAADEDVPAIGKKVCEMLNAGVTGNPNPVPAVRGVISTLANNGGITKQQAVGLTQVSAVSYCPQFARLTGR
jgi:hypothetical protein